MPHERDWYIELTHLLPRPRWAGGKSLIKYERRNERCSLMSALGGKRHLAQDGDLLDCPRPLRGGVGGPTLILYPAFGVLRSLRFPRLARPPHWWRENVLGALR